MWATNGMVIYDHTNNQAQNITEELDTHGYTHAVMHHLGPFKDHNGFLLILPAKMYGLSENFTDNLLTGGQIVRKIGTLLCPSNA